MYAIGVDFHKAHSHVTVVDSRGRVVRAGRIPNTAEAVRGFVALYREGGRAVVEATRNWTVMYDLLEAELKEVYLAHPLKVRAIAEARIKTDRIDSAILAHLLRCDLLPTAYVRPREARTVQQVLRQRMFFVRLRTMVKNRIHALIDRQPQVRELAPGEAVRPAVRTDSELRAYYERIRHRKGPNAAKVATARRLLTILYRVLSEHRPYRRSVLAPRTALRTP